MQRWQLGLIKAVVWVACLAPFALLAARAFGIRGDLGADPVSEVLHVLGKTGLNLLLITLAVTPVRLLTGFQLLARFRRLLGYHIVSQVGFMVTGVGLGTPLAISGAAAHAFAHILYKGLLFMGAGVVVHATGRRSLPDLGGIGHS